MNVQLPQIDFASHPAYGSHFGKPNPALRLRAVGRMAPALGVFMLWELRSVLVRALGRLKRKPAAPGFAEEFARNGTVAARIGPNVRARIADGLAPHLADLRKRLANLRPEEASYGDAQLSLRPENAGPVFDAVGDMLEEQGVFDLVRCYIPGALGRIKRITLQWNRAGETHWRNRFADLPGLSSTADYLHVDTGGGIIKAIYYVSDEVRPENGAFSYVLGSNRRATSAFDRIVRSAADHSGMSRTDAESRRLFNALPRFLQRKADFGFDVVDDAAEPLKARERVVTTEAGHLVVFDNFGAHRGGMVRAGERIILQITLW